MLYAFLLALPWSSLAILYLGSLSQSQELILVTLGIGMSACATVLLSAIPRAAFIYMSMILIPSALMCVLLGQKGYLSLGTLALSYWACLTALIAKTSRDDRERQASELALAERNTQLELASKAARVGSFSIDFATGIVKLSPGSATIYGLPEGTDETSRAYVRQRVHPADLPQLVAQRDKAFLAQQREFTTQCRIVRADNGQVRWLEVRSLIFYHPSGKPLRLIGANIDITERKRTEVALAERNAQLTLAGRAALVGSYAYDVKRRMLEFSEGYAAIFDLPEGTTEMTGDQRRALVHPEDLERLDRVRIQAFEQRRGEFSIEYRNILPNRGVRWIESRSLIFYDSSGGPERLVGVNIDITERKSAELALAERNAQLALAGEAALVGSYAYEADLERMTVSEGYAAMHGLPEGTTDTTRSEWRTRVHPDDLERMESFRERAFGDRKHVYNVEYRIVRASGEVRWIESRSFITYDNEGRPRRVIGINIDITERKRAEERQRVLVAELDHRVKNVLATVSAIIAQTQDASSSQIDFVNALNRRINSLARTHGLLSESNWRGASLAEIVRREFAPYAAGNAEARGPGVNLKAEATQAVATVLHELTTNAAKYGAFSNRTGRVSVQWRWRQNGSRQLLIEWKETGGPPVVAPSRSGYGTSIIRELIPFELGGKVELVFASEGIRCRLEIPTDWISGDVELGGKPGALDEIA
jgi:PAS domain S-box-containing protein